MPATHPAAAGPADPTAPQPGAPVAPPPGGPPLPGTPGAVVTAPLHVTADLPRGAIWAPGVMGRTWREYGYLLLALLVAPLSFVYAVVAVVLPPSVAVTVVGLFVAGWVIVGGRMWAALYRGMARGMLGTSIAAPMPRRRRRGFWRRLGVLLGDAPGWRGVAFGALALPLAIVGFVVPTTFLAVALGGTTHWFWYRWLPLQEASDGSLHRGASFGTDYFIDTPPRQWILIAVGLLAFLAWHRLTLGFAHLFRLLSQSLLGPTASSLRVAHLEQTRGTAVTDADTRLRRIERDLHDGTQARLVAVAMQIGDARDRLAHEPAADPATLGLLAEAHGALKDTLTELREIARGIHPPALDNGLAVALETLAARSPVPVTVDVDLPARPAPEVETIAYFAVAELLTNVVRHSGASGAYVRVEVDGGALRLRVRDDGHGGARLGLPGASGGSGLAGLADRVATVDGQLDVDSPVGGPTVVTVHLPLSAR
ncbi:sensor domain-containing protein [Cellulomonas sp. ACRRI]|uniref:sensor histidine kinase n=1 Tax=Cellulomonas sp. ACRRI TaxID=2918188 RepID=UPI001EF279AC|nr:sensor histidine kinase [Cellulomonas sp. ACRRI]MCG7287032.1 sensor domain-containing protein [Cellulomonas sp. ACRRI]